MLTNIYMKFCEHSLNSFQVIERTRVWDRKTDRQMPGGKTICLPTLKLGDIMIQIQTWLHTIFTLNVWQTCLSKQWRCRSSILCSLNTVYNVCHSTSSFDTSSSDGTFCIAVQIKPLQIEPSFYIYYKQQLIYCQIFVCRSERKFNTISISATTKILQTNYKCMSYSKDNVISKVTKFNLAENIIYFSYGKRFVLIQNRSDKLSFWKKKCILKKEKKTKDE